MKRFTVVLAALLLAGVAHSQNVAPGTPAAAPKDINKVLVFSNTDFDFGKIPQSKPVEYQILVKNVSTDSITLDNVQVGCGCTTPKYEKGKKFAPGETVAVTLGYNAASLGVFTKNATLYFNGGELVKIINFKGETYTTPVNAAPANATMEKIKPAGN